jgi:SAM-dependent methyltransferase
MTERLTQLEEDLKSVEVYQDILINDKLYKKGSRDCEERYDCIKKLIKIKERKFTVLDIGANFGFYSFKIARDFPNAFIVMIQPRGEHKILKNLCELNTKYSDRVMLLDCECTKDNMLKLSRCEHFDYVMCNNVLHHFDDWKSVYSSIKNMCKYLIVETPPPDDNQACGQDKLLGIYNTVEKECSVTSKEKFVRHTNKNTYSKIYFYELSSVAVKTYSYYNNCMERGRYTHICFDDKRVFEKKDNYGGSLEAQKYIHGINLFTFCSLNGSYPTKEKILDKLKKENIRSAYKWDNSLKDLTIWNLIMNEDIHLIDYKNTKDGGFPMLKNIKTDDARLEIIKEKILSNVIKDAPGKQPSKYFIQLMKPERTRLERGKTSYCHSPNSNYSVSL